MTIYTGQGQVTHTFTGAPLPNGAAVIYGVNNETALTALNVANIAHDAFGDTLMPVMSNLVTLTNTRVKLGPDSTGPTADTTEPVRVGAIAGTVMSPNVSYLVRKNSTLGGRRGKGRMFLPCVREATTNDAGVVDAATQLAFQTALDTLFARLIFDNVPMVLIHEPSTTWILVNGQPRRVPISVPAPFGTTVSALAMQGTVATQRRRLRG